MRMTTLLSTAAFLLGTAASQAATYSYMTIDNPADTTFNQLLGINDLGVISGYFGSGAAGHPNQGYTIAPPYTTFLPDNLPSSVQTQATGINKSGATSGFWAPTNLGGGDANYGFIRWNSHGIYRYVSVNDPNVTSNPPVNQLLGINNKNEAAGFYLDANGNSHGFVYSMKTAAYAEITFRHSMSVAATGINDNNLVSGFFVNNQGQTLGFVKPLIGGNGVSFSVPGSSFTQLLGVNNQGKAAGFFMDAAGMTHGLIYTPANGQWTQVDAPNGVAGTILNGLNNKNQLVGFYTDAAGNTNGLLVTETP